MKTLLYTFKRCVALMLSLLIAVTAILPAGLDVTKAESTRIDLDPVCCVRKYPVYGDQQPEGNAREGRDGNATGDCYVMVDLEPVLDDQAVQEALQAESAEAPGTLGLLGQSATESVPGAAESVASPLIALFRQSGLQKALVDLANHIFTGHTEKYHAFLDEEVFGKAIAEVSQHQKTEDFKKFLEDLSKNNDGKCSEHNPKPDCVIERALCSYEKYSQVLFHQSGQPLLDAARSRTNTATDLSEQDFGTVISVLQQRDHALLQEAINAREALDTAMMVYAQFYQTYRLHLRFKNLIEQLVKVRNLTSTFFDLVGCIPNKFVGVATTKCN